MRRKAALKKRVTFKEDLEQVQQIEDDDDAERDEDDRIDST